MFHIYIYIIFIFINTYIHTYIHTYIRVLLEVGHVESSEFQSNVHVCRKNSWGLSNYLGSNVSSWRLVNVANSG